LVAPAIHVDTRFSKEIDRDSIKELLGIIIRHNLGHMTAVHNLHRHDLLPAGTVRLEKNIGDVLPGAKLTPPSPVAELDFPKTHALTYVVDRNNLVPFEFEEGENSAPADAMTPEFLAEFTKFVNEKGLANIFALEIGDFIVTPRNRFAEFEIDRVGTLVVPSDNLTMTGPGDGDVLGCPRLQCRELGQRWDHLLPQGFHHKGYPQGVCQLARQESQVDH
jgi:hypothetical protein